jgi:2-polyprenyl-6-methoxyphenol hydroxylase-like FAD-dependent oxidoreductase
MGMQVAIVGSGPVGMTTALLLAGAGHQVTLVDRDPGPVAGRPWERVGVMQFHLPHTFRAPGRSLLAARLPGLDAALLAAGADVRDGNLHVRRSVLERAMWEHTDTAPGVRRLTGHVDAVEVTEGRATGVVVDGCRVPADLVVDASGRAAGLSDAWRPEREGRNCGFAYASRIHRLLPGAEPGPMNGGPGAVSEHQGFVQLVFTHDAGYFTVLVVRAAEDRELAGLRHEAAYEAAVRLLPHGSVWTEPARSVPVDHVRAGAGLFNHFQGQPTLPGLLAVGDAVCTTNPAGARGLTLGVRHAVALADVVAAQPPQRWAAALTEWEAEHLRPWFEEHLVADARTLEEWAGRGADPDGPVAWSLVAAAAREHPEWMATLGPFLGMMTGPRAVDPLREEVRAMLRAGWAPPPRTGVTRDDLVAAVSAAVPAEEVVEERGALVGQHS